MLIAKTSVVAAAPTAFVTKSVGVMRNSTWESFGAEASTAVSK